MRKELWKVVLRALLRNGVGWVEEDVGEQAWLYWRNVGEPTTHVDKLLMF